MSSNMKNPVHAGVFVREELMAPNGLSVAEVARTFRISRPHLHHVLSGQCPLSCEMALRFEALFNISANLLMNMQAAHDLAKVRRRSAQIVAGITRLPGIGS